MITAVIIDQDTLRAAGLCQLLHEHFGARATAMRPGETPPDGATAYFCTPDAILATPSFFMPRRLRTVIITGSQVAPGAFGVLDPQQPETEILKKLGEILDGMPPMQPHNHPNQSLSERETEVLKLVAVGKINKEIADELNISFHTVLSHRKNISAKLGIKSSSSLAVYAIINGLVTPSQQ